MQRSRTPILIIAALATLAAAVSAWFARGPDFEIHFERSVPSRLNADTLRRALDMPADWPRWFRDLKEARAPAGPVRAGSIVQLMIEPRGREWKRFELNVRVLELVPGRRLVLKLESDSRGRITHTVENLTWRIELSPDASGLTTFTVYLDLHARTLSWKSRLISRVAPRIALNQLIYPDPLLLAAPVEAAEPNPLLPPQGT